MRPYLVKTPKLIQRFFHNYAWRIRTDKKEIFLTFDDGPVPDFTPWVLKTLRKYKAKATFFCVGKNIEKKPKIYKKIIRQGHAVGNHTFNHLQGWIFNIRLRAGANAQGAARAVFWCDLDGELHFLELATGDIH